MTVALKQENVITEIGPGGILHALFSTIAYRLERGRWGSRFPVIMDRLYGGRLESSDVVRGLAEMTQIKRELLDLSPAQVIWDIDDPQQSPPWGREVGAHVRSVAGYFVTTTGRNLVDEVIDNLEALRDFGGTLDIISYDGAPPL